MLLCLGLQFSAMKSTCPVGAPRRQPLALAKSGHFSTPLRWGLQLWLPRRCLHNLVGIGHSCSRSASSQHAVRSLPVSTIGVPTHDAQLPSVRPNTCRPRQPSDILWAARSPELQQESCVAPRRTVPASVGRLVLSLPLEEGVADPLIVLPDVLQVECPIPSKDKTVWIEVGEGLIGMSNTLFLDEWRVHTGVVRLPASDSATCCATALDTALLKVSTTSASDPTCGLAQCRHPTQTDPLHHFNKHLSPGQTPQPSATTSRCPERCWGPPSSARWSSPKGLHLS